MRVFQSDVLCMGAGLAGERCGRGSRAGGLQRHLSESGAAPALPFLGGHGRHAGGPGQFHHGRRRQPEIHFNDTVKGSDWGCDQEVARLFAKTAPIAMREMA